LADNSIAAENVVMRASHTLSFQVPKLAFFIPGHKVYTGIIHLLDIGLDKQFYDDEPAQFSTLDPQYISSIFKSRNQFAHKYNFGHALLYAGSKNMMGAAILCAKGCLRSGAGLVTVSVEDGTQLIVQTALPEAITSTEIDPEKLSVKKSAIGIGPGFELSRSNNDLLYKLISGYNGPLVIDASALSILASGIDGFQHRKKQQPVVLTPHTGEFEKLFGKDDNDLERIHTARRRSLELGCYVILKGHHTLIACPDGQVFFNTTGNAGMATAGSGDVLTGMLTGLLAQGYSPTDACLLGVYLHGTAGDAAAEKMSQEAMIAGDIIDCIGEAFKKLRGG
ncbi:MAG: NAD(P)H-hydrate dehydratase, partial [Ferruginibacter sp.]